MTLLEKLYGVRLSNIEENPNPEKKNKCYPLSETVKQRILDLNHKEGSLYLFCKELLSNRYENRSNAKNWLYGEWSINNQKIIGRAYKAFSKRHVSLALVINGKVVEKARANRYNPIRIAQIKQPLDGLIGFEFGTTISNPPNTTIEVVCTDSGQKLFERFIA